MEQPFTPIAVVGVGALMPGSLDVSGFWHNILAKKDLIQEIPEGHWKISEYYDANPKAPPTFRIVGSSKVSCSAQAT